MVRRVVVLAVVGSFLSAPLSAQGPASMVAPQGTDVERVWHLGRITGDLERIIRFYHDLLGLELRGARNQAFNFAGSRAINEFVNAPPHAEFRAAFLPIQGTSAATDAANKIYLEAFEYRNIERRQFAPSLADLGVSSLRLLVRDLDRVVAAAKAANVSFITAGGPVVVAAPPGLSGTARAIMLRDPDGYPVELVEVMPAPATPAPADSNVLGAQMSVVVRDSSASLAFYQRFIGTELKTWSSDWQRGKALSELRAIPEAEHRSTALLLPGSAIALELIQFRGVEQKLHRPTFQDIGPGHVALIVKDAQAMTDRLKQLGLTTLSPSGTWTQINPTTRAVYTRDHDGFFIEILERR
jgi:catechol 2,3-dioxygenase-like lactoylglutathione lyase family enzyme